MKMRLPQSFSFVNAVLLVSNVSAKVVVEKTALTLLYQNNLNPLDDGNHVGAILLDPMTRDEGTAVCAELSETLLSAETIKRHADDFDHMLQYLEFSGQADLGTRFAIQNATVSVRPLGIHGASAIHSIDSHSHKPLPVLCTQSDHATNAGDAKATASNQVTLTSKCDGNSYVGFRNQKSFRFLGIPYANPHKRFEYSTVYSRTNQMINTQDYGLDCAQPGDSNSGEDCLFLNIQTPYLPRSGHRENLKPVLFTIHGGGYTGGNGGSGFDAGNLASREDVVGVSINYRLGTPGFLAIPDTAIKGNYGIGDQVTALRWVRKNIALFGGDPNKITIIGESAGAGSVKALLGSPPVIKEQLIAGGIAQSNLGGGVGFGSSAAYSTPYSSYYTVDESYALAGQQIFHEAGCNQTDLSEQIQCLEKIPVHTLVSFSNVARFVVQDGHFVDAEELNVVQRNGSTAHVSVIFGATANDGASSLIYPKGNFTSEVDFLATALDVDKCKAQSIVDSKLFPYYNTGNLTLDSFNVTQRVITDVGFRCVDEAIAYAGSHSGVFPSAYYYSFDRTNGGYDPNNLGATGLASGPVTPGYPNGNPNLPYFRLHGSEIGFTYGNIWPVRDEDDIRTTQLVTGYFTRFAKTGDPNPSMAYLRVRGYDEVSGNIAHRSALSNI